MKITAAQLAAVIALLSPALEAARPVKASKPHSLHSRVNELSTTNMMWMGVVTEGGAVITLSGQASEIYKQILSINPEYTADKFSTNGIVARANISKRDLVTCYGSYSGAQYGANDNALQGSIQVLNLMGGLCHVPAQSCTVLECEVYSGIGGGVFACNNANEAVMAPCADFGGYASAIVDNCAPVQYSLPNGNKFNLHDGVYSVTGSFDTIVQRCGPGQ